MTEHKNAIEKVYWQDIREQVSRVNPGFAEVIDAVSPGKDLPLYKASYAYGQSLLKDGVFQVPTPDGGLADYGDPILGKAINSSFEYTKTLPIGMVLTKRLELFAFNEGISLGWKCMKPGVIFMLWSLLQQSGTSSHFGGAMWNMVAGARSLIMLPKLSFTRSFKRLKKTFNLSLREMPEKLADQSTLFTELVNSPEFPEQWQAEVLFLTDAWYEKLNDDAWMKVKSFLTERAWQSMSFLRDQLIFDFAYSRALSERNLRPNPYLSDSVKFLYQIAEGFYSSFKFANNDDVAPINFLENIFNDIYEINSAPTFMNLEHLDSDVDFSVYYSLNLPTQLMFSPRSNQVHNNLDDLREVKHIQQVTQDYFLQDKLKLKGLPLYDVLTKSTFEYYHTTADELEGIHSSKDLPDVDPDLQEVLSKYPTKPFCYSSSFLRGCIKINKNIS